MGFWELLLQYYGKILKSVFSHRAISSSLFWYLETRSWSSSSCSPSRTTWPAGSTFKINLNKLFFPFSGTLCTFLLLFSASPTLAPRTWPKHLVETFQSCSCPGRPLLLSSVRVVGKYICEIIRDTLDVVKQSAALCLLKLFKTDPSIIPSGGFSDLVSVSRRQLVITESGFQWFRHIHFILFCWRWRCATFSHSIPGSFL